MLLAVLLASSAPPSACKISGPQEEVLQCLDQELRLVNARLNAQWILTIKAFKAKARSGEKAPDGPNRKIDYEAGLIAAQRAWIRFRDAECGVEEDQAEAWADGPIVAATCLKDMTVQRTKRLRDLAADFEGR